MTVRQVFYALTVRHLIETTEAEYNGTVVRLLSRMRRDRAIAYCWIADNTRWVRQPQTYDGLADFLQQTARLYRRALWTGADCQLEVWCEKDALAGVILEETARYDVPLMVSRGFSSDTYLQSAAAAIAADGRPAFIYQFGDHDPSGLWISRKIEEGLRWHAPDATIHFERVAVTPEQIGAWNLPTRPTKSDGNTHARDFKGDSVELDAIPSQRLRALVRECIEQHADKDQLAALQVAEASERELLTAWRDPIDDAESEPIDAEEAARISLRWTRECFLTEIQRRRDRANALGQLHDAIELIDEQNSKADPSIWNDLERAKQHIVTVIEAIDGGAP
jgi:hypothetical protein